LLRGRYSVIAVGEQQAVGGAEDDNRRQGVEGLGVSRDLRVEVRPRIDQGFRPCCRRPSWLFRLASSRRLAVSSSGASTTLAMSYGQRPRSHSHRAAHGVATVSPL
jgi:hypothetical protein